MMDKLLQKLALLSNQLDSTGYYSTAEAVDKLIKMAIEIPREIKKRFYAKVDKSPKHNGCWIWTGARDSGGYGLVTVNGKNFNAHKLAWEWQQKKKVPKGMVLQHMCDNPLCVKPTHLIPGTQRNNVEDRVRKDRSAKGNQNGRARLNKKDIKKIKRMREKGHTESFIARTFNVGRSTISNILHNRTWNWLGSEKKASADDTDSFKPVELFVWKKTEGANEWVTYYKQFKAQVTAWRDRFIAKIFEGSDENHNANTQYKEFASINKEETQTGKGLALTKKWAEETIKIQEAPSKVCRNCKKFYKAKFEGWHNQFCSPFCKKRFEKRHEKKANRLDKSSNEKEQVAHSGDFSTCPICSKIKNQTVTDVEKYGLRYDPNIGEVVDDEYEDEDPGAYWPGMRPSYNTSLQPGEVIYARQSSVDKESVEHYQALIRSGQKLRRIDIGIDNEGRTIVYDGHHRISAYFAEKMPAPVRVFEIHA